MSKISLTLSIPHQGPHIPQLSLSCNNATYLSFKGTDIANARFGNGNTVPKKGWKRLEFGVTGSQAATRLSVMVNTSAILPPLAWSTAGPAPAASVARGGAAAGRGDLKNEAKLLRQNEEGKRGSSSRLQIEDGDQEWKTRGRNHPHQSQNQRTFDEKRGRSRADRGERVRRSERRRVKENEKSIEVLKDPYSTPDELEEVYRGEERKKRVRRRDRRGHEYDGYDDDVYGQRIPRREKREEKEQKSHERSLEMHKKVVGKKIASKYRKEGRGSEISIQHAGAGGFVEDIGHLPRDRYYIGREEKEKPQYRRSQGRRQEVLRPVDYGYDVDVAGE